MNDIIHSDIIIAGENALVSLKDARDFLGHARNWGVVDIFGGGLLSSCMKYGDIREYRKTVKKAELELRVFSDRMGCVKPFSSLDTKFDDFLKIVDLLRDNLWVDCMVQCRIEEATVRLDETIVATKQVLSEIMREDTISYFKEDRRDS